MVYVLGINAFHGDSSACLFRDGVMVTSAEEERFRRMREVTQRFLDAGIQPLHENCMNWGGMSPTYVQRMAEAVPGMKWVFDTGNPVFIDDRDRPA